MEFPARQESLQSPENSTDVPAVISGVLKLEENAIETSQGVRDAAEAGDVPFTDYLAVTISPVTPDFAYASVQEFRALNRRVKNSPSEAKYAEPPTATSSAPTVLNTMSVTMSSTP